MINDLKQNTNITIDTSIANVFGNAGKNWRWIMALGILFIFLGTIGLGMTAILTLVSVLFFGWLLIVGGVFQLVHAVKLQGWKAQSLQMLMAILYISAGAIVVIEPSDGAVALTVIIAATFIALGIIRILMAFQLRAMPGWGWLLMGGLMSTLLGVMIIAQWPSSALWVIGLIIAVEMIVGGWTYVMIALVVKRVAISKS